MDGYGPSTYGDRFAEVYDDWYADVSDIDATVARVAGLVEQVAADGGPRSVLELGVGSGRLALPLTRRGFDVWGIDASAAMVDRLRAKPGGDQVHVVLGDMADLDLGPGAPEFAVVLCAFNTLFNLTTEAAQRRCLAAVATHLVPGGFLIVEAFVPPDGREQSATTHAIEPRHIGLDEVVLAVSQHDPTAQTITGQHVQLRETGIQLRPWLLRYATPDQIEGWAEQVGLQLVEQRGGWHDEEFDEASPTHVSVFCKRPGR